MTHGEARSPKETGFRRLLRLGGRALAAGSQQPISFEPLHNIVDPKLASCRPLRLRPLHQKQQAEARRSRHLHLGSAALAALVLCIAGCRSPEVRVQEHMGGLRNQWQTNVEHQANIPELRIDWPTALAQLSANNLKLRQSRLEVTNAAEAVRQIYKDLIPTLNLRSGVTKNITDLAGTSLDDVTFSADSFFNIPGMVGLAARLYAARLMQLRAEAATELMKREQVIELYKLFLRAQEAQIELHHLDTERRTADAIREVDPFTGQVMLTEIELRELASERETQSLQQRASDLLGNYQYRWIFETNGLPELAYDEDPLPLTDTNRVAQLQMRWAAIELEAARAQMRGIKLRYWPELNIFISGPPIYQRAFGQERFWDADELRASADLFWYVDTRGHISRQLRQAKRQHELQTERLEQQSIALIDRLLHTQTLMRAARDKADQVDQHLAIMQAVPPAQNFASLQKYADEYRALVEQQRQLRRELAELETLFWFVDEYAWSKPRQLQADTNQGGEPLKTQLASHSSIGNPQLTIRNPQSAIRNPQ